MEFSLFLLCVVPAIVTSITISPNGNSPEIKMVGGMMVDMQKSFVPPPPIKNPLQKNIYKKLNANITQLSVNERYRRLIPYMTFYYPNDLTVPTTESNTRNVEVEKVEIIEAPMDRQQKKFFYSPFRNVPRYQGNRLHQYNVSPENTIKYKDISHSYTVPYRKPVNYPSYLSEHNSDNHDFRRFVQKQNNYKLQNTQFVSSTRKPYLNVYQEDDLGIQYYLSDKDTGPKYKLVPYEQTPPVKVFNNDEIYESSQKAIPVPVLVPNEQVYVQPRPIRPQYTFDNTYIQQQTKNPTVVTENYYEKYQNHQVEISKPVVESGFRPIINPTVITEAPYSPAVSQTIQELESDLNAIPPNHKSLNYEYVSDTPIYKAAVNNKITLGDLINSLKLSKDATKINAPIQRPKETESIRTLMQVLNTLRVLPQQNDVDHLVLSTPKPFVQQKVEENKLESDTRMPIPNEVEFNEEPYLATVTPPSQHLEDYSSSSGTTQRFPLPIVNDDEGGTPGRPGVDYPVLTIIPPTAFDCKTQRYKGFFADPETRCQVWHYCDLNGGQASFLCPNGTIFSQAGLTCDWWFNVRCSSTAQLYVLNESLYKYILPHSPKFPEDYSGPLVDKYLTLKYKEMEEQFKKNKHKEASEKVDDEDSTESSDDEQITTEKQKSPEITSVSESSVVVDSPGSSGNVERLQDE